ncbi:MAG: hypothetical protein LUD02_09390 [Tannerellaceae bacterium]|nr:hypothetical protein [Tannerellaceae bacterium]MCD8264328.1 hypothetical protein [Tannerellaceae bacterium]
MKKLFFFIGLCIIGFQQNVGGWPELKQGIKPLDTDHDGIPDEWAAAAW